MFIRLQLETINGQVDGLDTSKCHYIVYVVSLPT